MLKFYMYDACSTCREAQSFLDENGIEFTTIPIRDKPPTRSELRRMVDYMGGDLKKLFNSSGGTYRNLGLSERMRTLTTAQKINLLATHGNLVKRPFLIGDDFGLVGFKEDQWKDTLL
jgi:Spx/MgsR family transcriptional regulator